MPGPEHNLLTQFSQLGDQISGPVLDAIMIYPRSCGILHLPREHSTDRPPPAHKVDIAAGDPASPGVGTEENQPGGPKPSATDSRIRWWAWMSCRQSGYGVPPPSSSHTAAASLAR